MRELQHLASHASHLVQSSWISDWTHYIHTININQYNLHQSTYCKYLQALNFTESSVDSMAVCSVSLALAHPHNHGAKRSLHSSCVVLERLDIRRTTYNTTEASSLATPMAFSCMCKPRMASNSSKKPLVQLYHLQRTVQICGHSITPSAKASTSQSEANCHAMRSRLGWPIWKLTRIGCIVLQYLASMSIPRSLPLDVLFM